MINSQIIEKLRDDLMLASDKLNTLNAWPLLLWIFNLSIHAVSSMYLFIQFVINNTDIGISVYLCLIAWIFSYKIQLMILTSACHFASLEVQSKFLNCILDFCVNYPCV